jgi:hypothetical protein
MAKENLPIKIKLGLVYFEVDSSCGELSILKMDLSTKAQSNKAVNLERDTLNPQTAVAITDTSETISLMALATCYKKMGQTIGDSLEMEIIKARVHSPG